jgi:predicted Zn-dependent protease with MMP-like domain
VLAIQRALALDPDDPHTLAAAADLYINRQPQRAAGHPTATESSVQNDRTATGLEYARRGSRRIKRTRKPDKMLVGWLALLEGQALNDLGRNRDALHRLDVALAATPDDVQVRYERGLALFNLCRFHDAKKAFTDVLKHNADDPWAHWQLGLTLEALGDTKHGEAELAAAQKLSPKEFKAPVDVSADEFRTLVYSEAGKLSPNLKADLAKAKLETADLPELADLTAEDPPLQPTIVGLFRGAPLTDPFADGEPRAIILYRKNLARATTTRDELVAEIRTTLLHELGHLRGEDDDALRARGLE